MKTEADKVDQEIAENAATDFVVNRVKNVSRQVDQLEQIILAAIQKAKAPLVAACKEKDAALTIVRECWQSKYQPEACPFCAGELTHYERTHQTHCWRCKSPFPEEPENPLVGLFGKPEEQPEPVKAQTRCDEYLFNYRRLWSLNFPEDRSTERHLHFMDCVVQAVISQLQTIPEGNDYRANRYNTEDKIMLHVWAGGKSFDVALPRFTLTLQSTPAPSVSDGGSEHATSVSSTKSALEKAMQHPGVATYEQVFSLSAGVKDQERWSVKITAQASHLFFGSVRKLTVCNASEPTDIELRHVAECYNSTIAALRERITQLETDL